MLTKCVKVVLIVFLLTGGLVCGTAVAQHEKAPAPSGWVLAYDEREETELKTELWSSGAYELGPAPGFTVTSDGVYALDGNGSRKARVSPPVTKLYGAGVSLDINQLPCTVCNVRVFLIRSGADDCLVVGADIPRILKCLRTLGRIAPAKQEVTNVIVPPRPPTRVQVVAQDNADERWVYLGDATNDSRWYIDKTTIARQESGVAYVWIKVIHFPKKGAYNVINGKPYDYAMNGQGIYYSGEAEKIRFTLWEDTRQFWLQRYSAGGDELPSPRRDIAPDSMFELVYRYVFRHA